MKSKVTGIYKVYKDNGIVHLIIHDSSVLSYDVAKEIDAYIKASCPAKKHLKLLDARGSFVLEENTMHYFESPRVKLKARAQAILISSNTKQQVIDLFTEMNSRKLPTKLFVNYDDAVNWLKSFKDMPGENSMEE